MWQNYLTVGIRALIKNKTYAFINIFGLALGLAACLMILLYVRYELSYDEWLPNAENTYQWQTFSTDKQIGEEFNLQSASWVSGMALKKDFPQVEKMTYARNGSCTVLRNGEAVLVEHCSEVTGPFFDVLQFPLVEGDPKTALRNIGSAALSESEARRLFGSEDPLRKILTIMLRCKSVDHRITAVFKDLPKNSHMRFNVLASADLPAANADRPNFITNWGWQSGWFYVALKPGTDPETIHAQLPAWEKRNIPDQIIDGRKANAGDDQDYRLVNVRDVHLGKAQVGAASPGNDRRTIATFAIVAALILAMACVNFTNLATARASQRAREVALRKVLGASRTQLVIQFVGESMLVAALAMFVALAAVELLLPAFSAFLDADLSLTYFGKGSLLLPIVGLTLLVGAAGGVYPAFYLSRFQPALVLKANKSSVEAAGTGALRSLLVIAQFAVSIGLIICTAVIYAQAVHARTSDPGYKREGLIQIGGIGRRQLLPLGDTLVREVARVPGVVSVGRTDIGIATSDTTNTGVHVPGRSEAVNMGTYAVDFVFLPTMGIKLLAGRQFDEARPMDDATLPYGDDPAAIREQIARGGANVIINELAARRLGFKDPQSAIGKRLREETADNRYGLAPINIIGVVQDSRFRSVREPIGPVMLRVDKNKVEYMIVRYSAADPQRLREDIHNVWKRIATDAPFEAEFSDDIIEKLYRSEEARAETFAGFSLLAVVVACLGLFGLASFAAERRTKEIGVRKVLGARTPDIVRLLAWQFSKPVILANVVAWPVAWWAMRDWLNTFDARIDLGPSPFVLAGALALAIALVTIGGHALRVARANPIQALRYE